MKKSPSKTFLVKKLDKVFSLYIRQKFADENGYVKCYTCGKIHHWREVDCGHYISRRHYSTRWIEKNTRPQCKFCNIFNQGAADMFALHLVRDYGVTILEELNLKKNTIAKYSPFELQLMITEYEEKIENLRK